MNTSINNNQIETFTEENTLIETSKRFLESFQILMVGILLPALFLIGINTHNHTSEVKNQTSIEAKANSYVSYTNGTIDYGKVLSDKSKLDF